MNSDVATDAEAVFLEETQRLLPLLGLGLQDISPDPRRAIDTVVLRVHGNAAHRAPLAVEDGHPVRRLRVGRPAQEAVVQQPEC